MAKFILCGVLGDSEFGNTFEMKARTTQEALRAFIYQIDGFRAKLKSVSIRLRINGRSCIGNSEADIVRAMLWPLGENDTVVISPARGGAGGNMIAGALMVIAGVVAIILAVPTGGASIAAWSAGAAAMAAAGAIMIIGGAALMFTKTPKAPDFKSADADDKNTSFSNIDNMAGQGRPVPILLGRMLCGSFVVQQSIDTLPR